MKYIAFLSFGKDSIAQLIKIKELGLPLDEVVYVDIRYTPENAKCARFFTKEIDGLAQSWRGETVFCNPPYGRDLAKWVAKAHAEVSAGGGVLVDCVITDPPYLIEYKTRRRQNKDHKFCKTIQNDDNPQLIIDLIPLLYDVMKDNSPLYMFCGSDKVDFFKTEIEKYFTVKNLIVWDKGNHTAGDLEAQYGKRYEFIIYANKGRAPFNPEMPRYEDIWKFNKVSGKEQIHQNQKPTDLLSRIIRQHTREGDLILDTFGGSCATAVAAYRLQRDYIVFELDPDEYATGTKWLDTVRSQVSIFDLI